MHLIPGLSETVIKPSPTISPSKFTISLNIAAHSEADLQFALEQFGAVKKVLTV